MRASPFSRPRDDAHGVAAAAVVERPPRIVRTGDPSGDETTRPPARPPSLRNGPAAILIPWRAWGKELTWANLTADMVTDQAEVTY